MAKPEKNLYEELYKSELFNLVNLATYFLGSRPSAEEAVQDAFIKLHTNWNRVDNPKAYVKRATINRCKDIIKMSVRRRNRLRLVYDGTENQSEQHYLVDVLQKIEPNRRMILVLRFYGDYKLSEMAELLEMPEGTIRSNLYRGLDQLRELLPHESRL